MKAVTISHVDVASISASDADLRGIRAPTGALANPYLFWKDETMLLNERERELERLRKKLLVEEEPVEQPPQGQMT